MPVKKRFSKSKTRPDISVAQSDYELAGDGGGIFLNEEVAQAFGRNALIMYNDIEALLEGYI